MSYHDEYDFSLLINEKEKWVIDELEHQLADRSEVCKCSECILDMVAFSLNNTKPVYRVTLLGQIYAQYEDPQAKEEISKAVSLAVDKISKNPSHPKKNLQ